MFNTKQARSWLKRNGYKPIKRVHETAKFYRYRIRKPGPYNYRTKMFSPGILAVIGFKR